jgi:hypothetical protein
MAMAERDDRPGRRKKNPDVATTGRPSVSATLPVIRGTRDGTGHDRGLSHTA